MFGNQDKRQSAEQLCGAGERQPRGGQPSSATQGTLLPQQRPAARMMYFYGTVFVACEYREQRRGSPGIASNAQHNNLLLLRCQLMERAEWFSAAQADRDSPGLCPRGFLCPEGSDFTILLEPDEMSLKPAFPPCPPPPAPSVCIRARVGCTTSVSRKEQSSRAGREGRQLSRSRHRPRASQGSAPTSGSSPNLLPTARALPLPGGLLSSFPHPRGGGGSRPHRFPAGWACLILYTAKGRLQEESSAGAMCLVGELCLGGPFSLLFALELILRATVSDLPPYSSTGC